MPISFAVRGHNLDQCDHEPTAFLLLEPKDFSPMQHGEIYLSPSISNYKQNLLPRGMIHLQAETQWLLHFHGSEKLFHGFPFTKMRFTRVEQRGRPNGFNLSWGLIAQLFVQEALRSGVFVASPFEVISCPVMGGKRAQPPDENLLDKECHYRLGIVWENSRQLWSWVIEAVPFEYLVDYFLCLWPCRYFLVESSFCSLPKLSWINTKSWSCQHLADFEWTETGSSVELSSHDISPKDKSTSKTRTCQSQELRLWIFQQWRWTETCIAQLDTSLFQISSTQAWFPWMCRVCRRKPWVDLPTLDSPEI